MFSERPNSLPSQITESELVFTQMGTQPLSDCVSVCVVTAAQTADTRTVVSCFAEMMMPLSIQ